jgi:hypothetical protein
VRRHRGVFSMIMVMDALMTAHMRNEESRCLCSCFSSS